jgi:pimeloyl-ACP methyl ester carboxylesterase
MAFTYRQAYVGLAYEFTDAPGPVTVFCPGFKSDMQGTKALHLWQLCQSQGHAMLRFDYSGHGASSGNFASGTISDWTADAAHIIAKILPKRDIILVGSSMGGWISLLLARTLGPRLKALLLIAPAPDFTELLIRPILTESQRETLQTAGLITTPSLYGDPTPITQKLLEDGAKNLVLNAPIPVSCPVTLLHGMADRDVPWQHSLTLTEQLESQAVRLIFIKEGDHRLSREQDLALLEREILELIRIAG